MRSLTAAPFLQTLAEWEFAAIHQDHVGGTIRSMASSAGNVLWQVPLTVWEACLELQHLQETGPASGDQQASQASIHLPRGCQSILWQAIPKMGYRSWPLPRCSIAALSSIWHVL